MAAPVYVQVADVQKTRVFQIDNLDTGTIQDFILGYEAEINAVLADSGYTTPATGDADKALIAAKLRKVVIADCWLAAASQDEAPDWVGRWLNEWSDFISEFRDGTRTLVDQTPSKRAGYAELSEFETWEALDEDDDY